MRYYQLTKSITAGMLLSLIISSCTGTNAGKGGTDSQEITKWAGEQVEETKYYRITNPMDTFYLTLQSNIQWLDKVGDYDLKPFHKTVIIHAFDNNEDDIVHAMRRFVDCYDKWVEPDAETTVEVSTAPNPNIISWSVKVDGEFIELADTHVSYAISTTTYLGGAHPNVATDPFTYILESESVVTLSDLFIPGSENTLSAVICQNLAQEYDVTPNNLTDAGFFQNDIKPSNFLFFEDGNIIFHYNQYDIAPYSQGQIDVMVPPYQVREILTPYFKRYFGVK